MKEFKVGDKVKIISAYMGGEDEWINDIGIIKDIGEHKGIKLYNVFIEERNCSAEYEYTNLELQSKLNSA